MTTLKYGTRLATKDGRVIGNAMVIDEQVKDFQLICTLITDFGNVVELTERELFDKFYIVGDYYEDLETINIVKTRFEDQLNLLKIAKHFFVDKAKLTPDGVQVYL